jgi:diguanylate cyclase (GGDEF)-like protein
LDGDTWHNQEGKAMAPGIMLDIIRNCLAIELKAEHIYEQLGERYEHNELGRYWRDMAREEERHIAYWRALMELAEAGTLPVVFQDPDTIMGQLRGVASQVSQLEKDIKSSAEAEASFLLAFRLEFYLMHPAFGTLFHYGKYLTRNFGLISPGEQYGGHLDHFIEALDRFEASSKELELIGQILQSLWSKNQELAAMGTSDPLTGVLSRRGFFHAVQPLIHLSHRHGKRVGLLLADIDNFKGINDQHGHRLGDKVLAKVAGIINRSVRPADLVGRFAAEEFAVFLTNLESGSLELVGEKILRAVQTGRPGGLVVTLCLGGAQGKVEPPVDEFLDKLIFQAGQRLYLAKDNGHNRLVIHA